MVGSSAALSVPCVDFLWEPQLHLYEGRGGHAGWSNFAELGGLIDPAQSAIIEVFRRGPDLQDSGRHPRSWTRRPNSLGHSGYVTRFGTETIKARSTRCDLQRYLEEPLLSNFRSFRDWLSGKFLEAGFLVRWRRICLKGMG